MPTFTVSDGALALLRRNLTGPQILVTDENREAYRELAGAGLMIPLHTFAHGDESAYRLTEAGVNFARAEVERCSSQQPSVPSNRPASRQNPPCPLADRPLRLGCQPQGRFVGTGLGFGQLVNDDGVDSVRQPLASPNLCGLLVVILGEQV